MQNLFQFTRIGTLTFLFFVGILITIVFSDSSMLHAQDASAKSAASSDSADLPTDGTARPDSKEAVDVPVPELDEKLSVLKPFLGDWEIDAKWVGGGDLWAKNEYRVGVGGKFVEARTYAKNEETGEVYCRYLTIFAWDDEESKIVSHGFTFEGKSVLNLYMDVSKTKNGVSEISSTWNPAPGSPSEIKQTITLVNEDHYQWQVWSRPDEKSEYSQMMNGVWQRIK